MTFDDIYNSYFGQIYRFCYRILGVEQHAEDITQEVFLRLYRELNGSNSVTIYRAWLYRVASNLCCNDIRRTAAHRRALQEQEMQPDRDQGDGPSRNGEAALIRESLCRLPGREQALLQLYQDGLTYAEIADVLEINPKSIGKMLSRAIRKASDLLKEGVRA